MAEKFDKFTDRARKVLTLAQEEAQRFNHNYIGTEHLLLGSCARVMALPPRCSTTWASSSFAVARLR